MQEHEIIYICLTGLVLAIGIGVWVLSAVSRYNKRKLERHAFIDLETLDTGPRAAVISAGLAMLDGNGVILKTIKILIDLDDARRRGTTNQETIDWWAKQTQAARAVSFSGSGRVDTVSALSKISAFFKTYGNGEVITYGNGPTFDLTILKSKFTEADIPTPWDHWNEACCRTVHRLGLRFGLNYKHDMKFIGTPHDPEDDALHQGRYTMATIKAIT